MPQACWQLWSVEMKQEPLKFGTYYHIFNRGNNRRNLFYEDENYRFFLRRYAQHIEPVAKTYAYCLLPNHFHLLVYVRTPQEQQRWHDVNAAQDGESWELLDPSKSFSNLFASYSMSMNRRYKNSGSMFEKRFKRKRVTSKTYFVNLLTYIYQNARHHRIVDDFHDWPWSSYGTILRLGATRLPRVEVIEMFGDRSAFVSNHAQPVNTAELEEVMIEDED